MDELNSFLKNKLRNNYQINNLANVMQALSEYVQTDDYLAYYNQPMEVQARTAQKRADMNDLQKKNISFADTDVLFMIDEGTVFEDIAKEYFITGNYDILSEEEVNKLKDFVLNNFEYEQDGNLFIAKESGKTAEDYKKKRKLQKN